MWENVEHHFDKYPGQKKVAYYIMENGLSVKNNVIMLNNIKISHSELAKVVGVDKRVISSTIKTIISDPKLKSIFSKLIPTCNLMNIASEMGWGVLAITLRNPALPGVLGKIASTIGKAKVSIRQVIGEDPICYTGLLFIVTESPVPGDVINDIKKIKSVQSITIE